MNLNDVKEAIMLDGSKRAKRAEWEKDHWLCFAEGVDSIPTDNIWNQHTKEQSREMGGYMSLAPYFIYCHGNHIFYGIDAMRKEHKDATDWEVF